MSNILRLRLHETGRWSTVDEDGSDVIGAQLSSGCTEIRVFLPDSLLQYTHHIRFRLSDGTTLTSRGLSAYQGDSVVPSSHYLLIQPGTTLTCMAGKIRMQYSGWNSSNDEIFKSYVKSLAVVESISGVWELDELEVEPDWLQNIDQFEARAQQAAEDASAAADDAQEAAEDAASAQASATSAQTSATNAQNSATAAAASAASAAADAAAALEIAQGAVKAKAYATIQAMIAELLQYGPEDEHWTSPIIVGQNFFIEAVNLPDLWVSEILEEAVEYTYVDDLTFVTALATYGHVDVGYYRLAALEGRSYDVDSLAKKTELPVANPVELDSSLEQLETITVDGVTYKVGDGIDSVKIVPYTGYEEEMTINDYFQKFGNAFLLIHQTIGSSRYFVTLTVTPRLIAPRVSGWGITMRFVSLFNGRKEDYFRTFSSLDSLPTFTGSILEYLRASEAEYITTTWSAAFESASDENGDAAAIQINGETKNIPQGTVKTVNGNSPDSAGNVDIAKATALLLQEDESGNLHLLVATAEGDEDEYVLSTDSDGYVHLNIRVN